MLSPAAIRRTGWFLAMAIALCTALAIVGQERAWLAIIPVLICVATAIYYPGFIHLLLIAVIPLSVEWQVGRRLGTDFPDETLMWLLTLPVAVLLIRDRDERTNILRRHLIFRLLLVQWLWACTTILFSSYPLLSIKYAAAKAWYILPFAAGAVLFLDTRRRLLRAALAIMCTMAAATVWVLIRQAEAGFAFGKVNDAVKPLFRNHVNYSALLVCLLPLAVAGAAWSTRYRKHFIILSLFWTIAVFLTYSRGAWMAIPVGAITAWALHKRRVAILSISAIIIIMGSVAYLASHNRYLDHRPDFNRTIYHSDLAGHIEATYRMRDLSTAERFHRWIAAFRMMDGHWLQGNGPNSFYPAYKAHVVNAFRTYVSANPEHSTVHDYFLLLLTEQGLPGLLFFLVLLGWMFHNASKAYHGTSDRFTRIVLLTLAAILGMIINLIALSDLMETDKVGPIFYTIAGLLCSVSLWSKPLRPSS